MTVDNIETVNVSADYGKIVSVKVTVTNDDKFITPQLQLIIYDVNSDIDVEALHKNQVAGEKILAAGIKKGQRWTTTITVDKLRGYKDIDEKKTVIVKLVNYDNDELIKQVKKEILIGQ